MSLARIENWEVCVRTFRLANLGLRFALEMCALGLLGLWGYHSVGGAGSGLAVGAAVALLFAVLWGLLASPKAPTSLSRLPKVGVQMCLLLLPAASLLQLGESTVAGGFAALVVGNAAALEATR